MSYFLILCRSVTYAQRTAGALSRSGVKAHILRAPQAISAEGCSHCVKVSRDDLPAALDILERSGLAPKHVFAPLPDGGYREVDHGLS